MNTQLYSLCSFKRVAVIFACLYLVLCTRCKNFKVLTPFMNNKYESFYNALRNFGLCFCIFEEMTRDFFTEGNFLLTYFVAWLRTKAKYCEGKRRCQSFLLMGYRTPGVAWQAWKMGFFHAFHASQSPFARIQRHCLTKSDGCLRFRIYRTHCAQSFLMSINLNFGAKKGNLSNFSVCCTPKECF